MYKTRGALMTAAFFALLIAPAAAQTKPVSKVLLDNASVRVISNVYAPGSVNPMVKRPNTVVYVVAGPQHVKFTYADGHVVTATYATGTAFFSPAATRSITNVGTNSYTTIAIQMKH
jgi:hypothetical protein